MSRRILCTIKMQDQHPSRSPCCQSKYHGIPPTHFEGKAAFRCKSSKTALKAVAILIKQPKKNNTSVPGDGNRHVVGNPVATVSKIAKRNAKRITLFPPF